MPLNIQNSKITSPANRIGVPYSPLNTLALALCAASIANPVLASDSETQALTQRIAQLEQQVNLLAERPAVSTSSSTYLGGYGELHYNNLTTKQSGNKISEKQELDFHRFVLFINHNFSGKIRLFSEIELEHSIAGEGQEGEIELEQAYIEMDLTNQTQFKAGVMLQPVGILNETHEPNTFYGVERNPVEKNIIPATWWSGGVALTHRFDQGLQADFLVGEGLKTSDGYSIRTGRQKTAKATAKDLAYTARLQYAGISGLTLAGSLHYESNLSQGSVPQSGSATLMEGHLDYQVEQFRFKALYAQWDISGQAAKQANADQQIGYYLEPSYKLNEKLGIFTRYNVWNNTTKSQLEQSQWNLGVNFWPHPDVVFKADYQIQNQGQVGTDKKTTGFNLAVGYQF